jgi:drug/metabolite transporter (DMT)-like permease
VTTPVRGSDTTRAALAAAVASICFGASVVATRFVVAQTQPVSLAFMRYLIAIACLAPIVCRGSALAMPRRDLLAIGVLGVVFFGVFPWSFSASLTHLPTSRVAVELATMPLLTLIVSRLRGYDHLTPAKVIGQALAFVGLVIALRPAAGVASLPHGAWVGDVEVAITAVAGAVYNVFSRPYLRRYPPLTVTALSMVAGLVFLAPMAAAQGMFSRWPVFTTNGWLALFFLGVFGGALGFGLWIWALQRSTPSRVAVFITLNPITAVLLSALLLHETVTMAFVVGLVCVLSGIVFANWRPASGD